MFKIGDVVRAKVGTSYRITGRKVLCKVVEIHDDEVMSVIIVGAEKTYTENKHRVFINDYEECRVGKYLDDYPGAMIFRDRIPEYLAIYGCKEGVLMDNTATYTLPPEEREALADEMLTILKKYGYNVTNKGVNAVIDEWVKNKGWMIELFKKHPNYNGKYQIVFSHDYQRKIDGREIDNFCSYLDSYCGVLKKNLKECKITAFTYKEAKDNRDLIDNKIYYMRAMRTNCRVNDVVVDGKTIVDYTSDRDYFQNIINKYRNEYEAGNITITNGRAYGGETYKVYKNAVEFVRLILNFKVPLSNEEFAKRVNELFEVKAVKDQKVSRIVNKVCSLIGATKNPDWNKKFAKYSDAINPIAIKRHTILSCHPIDYYTMSFGNSWASCHTIDKQNLRGMPNGYSGAYSSGTESYMLDESSFVFYTVDKKYDGNEFELQSKINRNMFHMGADKLVQARVYPQANDGEGGIYTEIREIVLKVIADCLGVPNTWKNSRGTNACRNAISTSGTHYCDYTSFESCNVSTLKREDGYTCNDKIKVGHLPICPGCGHTHRSSENITCTPCRENRATCSRCGSRHEPRNMVEIDGQMYCRSCTFYCQYHNRYEVIDGSVSHNVDGYGLVCEEALRDSGVFAVCDECGGVMLRTHHSVVVTEDGHMYCDYNCAERAGYEMLDDGTYIPLIDARFCEECFRWVRATEYNEDRELCAACASTNEREVA